MAADHCRATVSSFQFAVDPSFHNLIENEFGESGLIVAAAREICGHLRHLRIFIVGLRLDKTNFVDLALAHKVRQFDRGMGHQRLI